MSAPIPTYNTAGNALASQSLAASASVTFNVDCSTAFDEGISISATFGTIAASAGLQIQIFEGYGSTPTYPTTNPSYSYTLPAVAGAQTAPKIHLFPGKFQIKLTNLDATNGLTLVSATGDLQPGSIA